MDNLTDFSMDVEKKYQELFSSNLNFRNVYFCRRNKLYKKIIAILKELGINSFIDIGCAYGQLVELGNEANINAYGLDLPIEELQNYHKKTKNPNKYIYGSMSDEKTTERIKNRFQALIMLDTLRHLTEGAVKAINNLGIQFIIIKEVANNFLVRYRRKKEFDVKLYSPTDYRKIFPNYKIIRVYSPKFIFKIKDCNNLVLRLLNFIFPTYTLILQRK